WVGSRRIGDGLFLMLQTTDAEEPDPFLLERSALRDVEIVITAKLVDGGDALILQFLSEVVALPVFDPKRGRAAEAIAAFTRNHVDVQAARRRFTAAAPRLV